jgi:hypothetical protein
MDREVRLAQHHPSPHRGVEGSRRDSTDQVTTPPPPQQSCLPLRGHRLVELAGRVGGAAVTITPPPHPLTYVLPQTWTWADIVKGENFTQQEALPLRLPTPLFFTSGTSP